MCAAPSTAPAAITLAEPPPRLLAGASLFLDFDGTLVDIAARPDAVRVAPALAPLLVRLSERLDGRLAIVSGRAVAEIHGFLGRAHAVSGSHGVEWVLANGRTGTAARPAWLPAAIEQARAFAAERPGVLIEEKPFGLAIHYRQAPDTEPACRRFAQALAGDTLHLQTGKMVAELRDPGTDKGTAVRRFLDQPGWAGTTPVFIGDDLTDEAAFVVAREAGGTGILVGPARATAADFRLADVAATLAWLALAAEQAA